MSCRIERLLIGKDEIVLRVSGRIHAEHVGMLQQMAERETRSVAIDLHEVDLVGRDSVKLLAAIEAKGNELRNCPTYIREWIARERGSNGAV
jgi:anti-anti-sigma regulatory factor